MDLIEKSAINNDFKNIENLVSVNTYDIHENVSYDSYNIV